MAYMAHGGLDIDWWAGGEYYEPEWALGQQLRTSRSFLRHAVVNYFGTDELPFEFAQCKELGDFVERFSEAVENTGRVIKWDRKDCATLSECVQWLGSGGHSRALLYVSIGGAATRAQSRDQKGSAPTKRNHFCVLKQSALGGEWYLLDSLMARVLKVGEVPTDAFCGPIGCNAFRLLEARPTSETISLV